MLTPTSERSPAPVVRAARPDDLPAVERLLAEAGLPTVGVAEILAARADDFVVAEEALGAHALVAVAGLEVCRAHALLRSVAVRPAWRGRGLARDLVGRLVDRAAGRGVRALYLLTTTAEGYFPRLGFVPVARAAVPAAVAATAVFRDACPASAAALVRPLDRGPG